MRPARRLSRRDFLITPLICGGLSLTVGCTNPMLRTQSPERADIEEFDLNVRLIGDVTGPYGLNYAMVEGAALVVNLDNTGCDPPAGPQREQLMADMLARNVANPNQLLASPRTSLVWAKAYLPPAAEVGDPLDIEITVPEGHPTSDLSGGWMLEVRLREMGMDLQGGAHTGHVLAKAEGAVLVDPDNGDESQLNRLRGRILSGGRVVKSRTFGLLIKNEERSVFLSKQIGEAINRRFHTYVQSIKQGVAKPKNDAYIELLLHPRYKHNLPRYIRVLRAVALRETAAQQLQRLTLLERQLNDPVTAADAAIKLEALGGKEAINILRRGITATDPEVSFYSAEALAYLDDSHAAIPLGKAARDEPAFRVFALTALSTMDDISASDELKALLDSHSVETRTGAFRALWGMNPGDPVIAGKQLSDRLWLHQVPSTAPPLVHINRTFRPEVVLFGNGHQLRGPAVLEAGKSILVKVENESRVVVSRFAVGEPDKRVELPNALGEIIRTVVELGGQYPDVVQLLHDADRQRVMSSRLEVETYPQPGRRFDRPENKQSTGDAEIGWAMPNLFGRRQTDSWISSAPEPQENSAETDEN